MLAHLARGRRVALLAAEVRVKRKRERAERGGGTMTRRGRGGSIDCAALLSRTHTPSTLQAFTRAADGTTPSTTTAAWRGGGAPALAAAAQQQRRWATNSHDVFNTVRKESGEEREGDSTRARALAARRASPVVRKGRERERERGDFGMPGRSTQRSK